MPDWVQAGYLEYARRLPPECRLELIEIASGLRSKGVNPGRARSDEGQRMIKAIPAEARVLALDSRGAQWSTATLARNLEDWLAGGQDLALLIGGPDGLDAQCLARAEQHWSLSKLTFPHPLVRVVVAEQLYRAWTIIKRHPYHRGGRE